MIANEEKKNCKDGSLTVHEGFDIPLIQVNSLKTIFSLRTGDVYAVNGLDFCLMEKERLALVGESGCGKSVLAQTMLRLLPENAHVSGDIFYRNKDVFSMNQGELENMRGKEIGLIPQNLSSLDPLMKIGGQIQEACLPHSGFLDRTPLLSRIINLIRSVKLDDRLINRHPYELSGGMNRRTLIAMGIAQSPPLLIADEPTTGLDTIIKGKIVNLIEKITHGRALLLITHDIPTAKICEHVAVMYAGEIIEKGITKDILEKPRHPYTRGLISSMPSKGMNQIPGQSPSLVDIPQGCRFHPRCSFASEKCKKIHPVLAGGEWKVRCHNAFSTALE